MPNTQTAINHVCLYRQLPRVLKGTKCEVDGDTGIIWGGNHSSNFNVKFDDGKIRNCHPGWRMKIFDGDGGILYESEPEYQSDLQAASGGLCQTAMEW